MSTSDGDIQRASLDNKADSKLAPKLEANFLREKSSKTLPHIYELLDKAALRKWRRHA
jgi:hypothetical protein